MTGLYWARGCHRWRSWWPPWCHAATPSCSHWSWSPWRSWSPSWCLPSRPCRWGRCYPRRRAWTPIATSAPWSSKRGAGEPARKVKVKKGKLKIPFSCCLVELLEVQVAIVVSVQATEQFDWFEWILKELAGMGENKIVKWTRTCKSCRRKVLVIQRKLWGVQKSWYQHFNSPNVQATSRV